MSHGLAIQLVGELQIPTAEQMIGLDGRRLAKGAAHDLRPSAWTIRPGSGQVRTSVSQHRKHILRVLSDNAQLVACLKLPQIELVP